jgi:hypothetical protein
MGLVEQRRTQRYSIRLPLAVTRNGGARTEQAGFTRNISSTGVLFDAPEASDLSGFIEYIITLDPAGPQPVHIRCVGRVVRSERATDDGQPSYSVAATLERYEFLRRD